MSDDLPLPVQVVLARAYPLMQKKEYVRAIEVLQKFQARGGPDIGGRGARQRYRRITRVRSRCHELVVGDESVKGIEVSH